MQLTINGQPAEVSTTTLAELLQSLGYTNNWLAVAVDGEHVPKSIWNDTELREFQSLEILAPMQGG